MRLKSILRRGEPEKVEVDMDALYDQQWARVDPGVKLRTLRVLRQIVSVEDQQKIRDGHAKYGPHVWVHKDPFDHMFFGMVVRNELRRAGILDAELPSFDDYYGEGTDVRNWDDCYVQALEAAVGLR